MTKIKNEIIWYKYVDGVRMPYSEDVVKYENTDSKEEYSKKLDDKNTLQIDMKDLDNFNIDF